MNINRMENRVDFREDNRYGTDSGPQCPTKCSVDGDTLWVFWVYPGQTSTAQCACCHTTVVFRAPGSFEPTPEGMRYDWPHITDVVRALRWKLNQ